MPGLGKIVVERRLQQAAASLLSALFPPFLLGKGSDSFKLKQQTVAPCFAWKSTGHLSRCSQVGLLKRLHHHGQDCGQ